MSRSKYKIHDDSYPYFITCMLHKGTSLFADLEISAIIISALDFLQNKRNVQIHAYVIMHNHMHLILQGENLAEKIRKMKSYTARSIIDSLRERGRTHFLRNLQIAKDGYSDGTQYRVWDSGFRPKQIGGHEMMLQKLVYIHQNPVKAGFVDKPEYWRLSSAGDYDGGEGLISITRYER